MGRAEKDRSARQSRRSSEREVRFTKAPKALPPKTKAFWDIVDASRAPRSLSK
jgi:hypothetical protein